MRVAAHVALSWMWTCSHWRTPVMSLRMLLLAVVLQACWHCFLLRLCDLVPFCFLLWLLLGVVAVAVFTWGRPGRQIPL